MPAATTELRCNEQAVRVWDRLWSHAPTDERDDALIERERRGLRWRYLLPRLRAAFGDLSGLRTIELGSGRGDISVLLAELGAKVTLLDASELALDQARRRFSRRGLDADCVVGDLFSPAAELIARFDLSLSTGVIEHFVGEQRTRAVRAHAAVLRNGGMTMISVPNAWCLPYRLWKFYLELRGWWPYGTERPYSRCELVRRAGESGLEHIEATCLGYWQSVGDHVCGSLLRRKSSRPDWVARPSCLDPLMGLSAIVTGRKGSRD